MFQWDESFAAHNYWQLLKIELLCQDNNQCACAKAGATIQQYHIKTLLKRTNTQFKLEVWRNCCLLNEKWLAKALAITFIATHAELRTKDRERESRDSGAIFDLCCDIKLCDALWSICSRYKLKLTMSLNKFLRRNLFRC